MPTVRLPPFNVTAPGSQYSVPPNVNVTSAAGTGALLNATLNAGTLTGVTITEKGGTYTSAPTVTIDPPPAGGTQATATATEANGRLTSITLVNKGSGYTTVPNLVLSGGGIQPNNVDNGVGLTATNSIFSDALNAANVFGSHNVVPTAPAGGAGLLVGQYCNGARVPPEQCSSQQGANNQGMCLGYFTPAGISENVGVPQVFRFQGIAATATVDEGNNWINMTYGPLTLSRPSVTTPTAQEQMLTVAAVGSAQGAYSIPPTSVAVNKGSNSVAPTHDFFGNTRPLTNANPADIGAVEVAVANVPLPSVSPASLAFGNVVEGATSASQELTLSNNGAAAFTGITVTVTSPFSRITTGTFPGGAPNGGNSGGRRQIHHQGGLHRAGDGWSIDGYGHDRRQRHGRQFAGAIDWHVNRRHAYGQRQSDTAGLRDLGNRNVERGAERDGDQHRQLSIGRSRLHVRRWHSAAVLANGRKLRRDAGGRGLVHGDRQVCSWHGGGLLQDLDGCGRRVTVTGSPVTLTGTGVATKAAASITPNPLTITLPSGAGNASGTGVVTLQNTAPVGGAQIAVSNVAVSGGSLLSYFFNIGQAAGTNTCTGATLAPQASCTVTVRFTNVLSPRGANRAGTITFTDNAQTATQIGGLIGHATP